MIIIRDFSDIKEPLNNPVVTIGNFDGVHLGHREIFLKVKRGANQIGGVSVVITFSPHPLKVLPSGRELQLINTYTEKELLIEASGIDYLIVIPFTENFAAISAADFVSEILVRRIGIKRLIIGYDYAFGRNREGSLTLLRRLGGELGFEVEVLAPIGNGTNIYSSTNIRSMINNGDVKGVVSLLGRHFSLVGRVVHGHHRGQGLGFPTANLETDKELRPKSGVYAVKVKIDAATYDGACNIGSNPTFGDEKSSIEVFIFDFSGDLYGRELELFFVERIREERKFSNIDDLRQSISQDVAHCREILHDTSVIEYHLEEG